MNPFATHMPALLACLEHTSGPVLELGSGWFSTPIVSAFATDRLVRTIETNPEWYVASPVSGSISRSRDTGISFCSCPITTTRRSSIRSGTS